MYAQANARIRTRTRSDRITRFTTASLLSFYGAWMFMLAVGVIHHEWIPACPTIGFWWALLLCGLIRSSFLRDEARVGGGSQ